MNNQSQQQEPSEPEQNAPSAGFGVAASPFNSVKMELGIALIIGLVLWLAADSITASVGAQLLLLVGYGLISSVWLIFRTHRVLKQCGSKE